MLGLVDRGSILLVVYTAFSAAVIEGLWKQVPLPALIGLLAVMRPLAGLRAVPHRLARAPPRLRQGRRDHDRVLRLEEEPGQRHPDGQGAVRLACAVGAIVLPLMLFHQMQLMVCAVLAQRYAKRVEPDPASEPARQVG